MGFFASASRVVVDSGRERVSVGPPLPAQEPPRHLRRLGGFQPGAVAEKGLVGAVQKRAVNGNISESVPNGWLEPRVDAGSIQSAGRFGDGVTVNVPNCDR
jgi:hypothetical protein